MLPGVLSYQFLHFVISSFLSFLVFLCSSVLLPTLFIFWFPLFPAPFSYFLFLLLSFVFLLRFLSFPFPVPNSFSPFPSSLLLSPTLSIFSSFHTFHHVFHFLNPLIFLFPSFPFHLSLHFVFSSYLLFSHSFSRLLSIPWFPSTFLPFVFRFLIPSFIFLYPPFISFFPHSFVVYFPFFHIAFHSLLINLLHPCFPAILSNFLFSFLHSNLSFPCPPPFFSILVFHSTLL